jgi:hypothetical protein
MDSCSFPRQRLAIVRRFTLKYPFRFFPLICVKPRKSNVSGFPSPLPCRGRDAGYPAPPAQIRT